MPTHRSDAPRVMEANRRQVELRACDLEATLPDEHRARSVWDVVEGLDLSAFYDAIVARGSMPGRPAVDPRILVALWVYATSEGVGSARELARLCERDDAYRWLCGGVAMNHHTLSDFRVGHGVALDDLLTQIVAVLMHQKVIRLERIAQDGMKVRASAGSKSFRRQDTLTRCRKEAAAQVRTLRREVEEDTRASTERQKAARERASRERAERVARALAELPQVQAAKDRNFRPGRQRERTSHGKRRKTEARVSTTDPEARVMKMADGGWRPAYNVQFATDTHGHCVVGVSVLNVGSDQGQLDPMLDDLERRVGRLPKEALVDGGYVKKESIEAASARGVRVYAPVPASRNDEIDPHRRKAGDSNVIASWRRRMASARGKKVYKLRAATAENTNADLRTWRGLDRFNVRGLAKVTCVATWAALTLNVLRWIAA